MGVTLGMILLDETVVGVALETIQDDLDMSEVAGHWVVNVYLLTLASAAAISGRLADLFGYRRVFLTGAVVFAASSAAAAAAQDGAWLLAARAAQGLGAATIFSLCLAFVAMSFPKSERGRAVGVFAMIGTTGLAIGPLVGGLFTELLSWRWIFAVNPIVAVGVIAVVVLVWQEPPHDTEQRPALDLTGLVTLALALTALVLAVMQGPTWGWSSPATLAMFAVGAISFVAFVRREWSTDVPLIDVRLFTAAPFVGANLGVFVGQFAKSSVIVFLLLYLQQELDFTAIEAGSALLPAMVMCIVSAEPAGRWVDRVGPGVPLLIGLTALAAAHLALSALIDADSYLPLVLPLFVWGAAVAVAFGSAFTAIVNTVQLDRQGEASGIGNESQLIGAACSAWRS